MGAWLASNYGTILVALGLAAAVLAIVRGLIRDKKKGKSSCGCNCAHCAMAGTCHQKKA